MPRPPRPILLLILALSLVCGVSSLAGIALGAVGGAWFLLSFEVVVLVASIMGVLVGLGRFAEAPALATLCVGGCVVVSMVLSEPNFAQRFIQGGTGNFQIIAGVHILPWAIGRFILGTTLVALSALIVLSRRPGVSLPFLARGFGLLAPILAALGAYAIPSVRGAFDALPQEVVVVVVIAGFFVFAVLISVAVGQIVRAFEAGIDAEPAPGVSAAEPGQAKKSLVGVP